MKILNYGKRGMALEEMLEWTNQAYKTMNLALIDKIPTPWRAYYNKRKGISSATPMKKSSVDFGGTIKGGQAIYFEAKSTENKTSFPLSNIEQHQINYLLAVEKLGGIGFFIIEFSALNERYLVPTNFISKHWEHQRLGGRKSITINSIREGAWLIPTSNVPADYLKIVHSYLLKKEA